MLARRERADQRRRRVLVPWRGRLVLHSQKVFNRLDAELGRRRAVELENVLRVGEGLLVAADVRVRGAALLERVGVGLLADAEGVPAM